MADHGLGRIVANGDLPWSAHAGWLAVTRLAKPWDEAALSGFSGGGFGGGGRG